MKKFYFILFYSLLFAFFFMNQSLCQIKIAKKVIQILLEEKNLIVKYGDNVIENLGDVRKIPFKDLKNILIGVDEIREYVPILIKISKIRNETVIPEMFHDILTKNTVFLSKIKKCDDVLMLLLSDNQNVVKGAYGELKRCLFFNRIENLEILELRKVIKTSIGNTDIDLFMQYKGKTIILESKEYKKALSLTDTMKNKIDKLSELSNAHIAIISTGEFPPNKAFLDYATQKGVKVLHGGNMQQIKHLQDYLLTIQ